MSRGRPTLWRQRKWLTSRLSPRSWADVLRHQRVASVRTATLLRALYFFPAFWILAHVPQWDLVALPRRPDLLWPVAWLKFFDTTRAGPTLLGAVVAGSVVGALAAEYRWARVLACVSLLEFLGLKFAYGKIHHLMHAWLLVLACLILLPRDWARPERLTRAGQHSLLLVLSTAQLFTALTYSLSGVGKVGGIIYQLWLDQTTSLHPSSLARHLADRLLQTNQLSLWGPWMIEHGAWLWPLMIGTIYLQLFALHFAARPHLHRWLGIGLVSFHVLTTMSLTIDFTPAVVLVGMLFIVSPLQPEQIQWKAALRELPLIGLCWDLMQRRSRPQARTASG